MKTKIGFLRIIFSVAVLFTLANCANSGSSSVSGYYIMNQQCYASGTTNVSAVQNCETGSEYISQNGTCYTAAGVVASSAYCSGSSVGSASTVAVCNGAFYYPTYGSNVVQCGTQVNCSGLTVYGQGGVAIRCE